MSETNGQVVEPTQNQQIRYTIPTPVDELMTEEQCGNAIKQFNSDVIADKSHPYTKKSHPLHKEYLKQFSDLHDVAAKAREGQPTQFDKMLAGQQEKVYNGQVKRVTAAKQDMEVCVSHGYDREVISPNITDEDCKILKAQRFLCEGELDKATSIIHNSFFELKIPAATVEAFTTMLVISENKADKILQANGILAFLNEKYKERRIKSKDFKPNRLGG